MRRGTTAESPEEPGSGGPRQVGRIAFAELRSSGASPSANPVSGRIEDPAMPEHVTRDQRVLYDHESDAPRRRQADDWGIDESFPRVRGRRPGRWTRASRAWGAAASRVRRARTRAPRVVAAGPSRTGGPGTP